MAVVFTTKCCQWCHQVNWDSDDGGYDKYCPQPGREGKKCDTNGEERKYDENGNRVWD
jgi:hypothetical protein